MIIEIIENVFVLFLFIVMFFVVWQSSSMVSEKRYRRHKGLTDYYDNPIKGDADEY